MQTILSMIKKEFLQLLQDRRLLGMSLIAPVMQVIIFAYAANIDVNDLKIGFLDHENSVQTREIRQLFAQSGYFTLVDISQNDREIDQLLESGLVRMVIRFGDNFTDKLIKKDFAPIQLLVDGSDGNSATIAIGYAQGILNNYSQNILLDAIDKLGKKPNIATIDPQIRVWYNPELKSMNFMIPGILGMVILIASTITSAISIVKEKENGTLEQLIVTPIKPIQIILGKLIPFSITSSFAIFLILLVNYFILGAPVKGSYLTMAVMIYVFLTTTLGLGLFISTVSNNQQQAALTTVFILIPPFIYFSGFVFPLENMPIFIQYISAIIPLKYFLEIIRNIFLKGSGIELLWQNMVIIMLFSTVILSLAVMRFRKKLE